MDIKLESEDANFAFPEVGHATSPEAKAATRGASNGIGGLATISGNRQGNGGTGRVVEVSRSRSGLGVLAKRTSTAQQGPVTLTSQLCTFASDTCLLFFIFFFIFLCFFFHLVKDFRGTGREGIRDTRVRSRGFLNFININSGKFSSEGNYSI